MTDQKRIILFCDVERPLKSAFITRLNRWISNNLVKVLASDCFSAGENVVRSAVRLIFRKRRNKNGPSSTNALGAV